MSKRFVSWAAVSSLPQAKKISVDDQLATNKEHVAKWDGLLVDEIAIRGKTRFIVTLEEARQYEEYDKLLSLIERRAFDVLVYLDRSRLGRKANLIDTIVEKCHQSGIVTYATESPPNSLEPQGFDFGNRVLGAIESIMAQHEVVKIQHRHEMGMAARVKDGEFPGKIPKGWIVRYEMLDDKPVQIIEVDEEAQRTIATIYDLYLNNTASIRTIRDYLTEHSFPLLRGNVWTDSAVQVVVNLAWRYAGRNEYNVRSKKRDYIEAKLRWPALISEETAKAVMAEKKRRTGAKRAASRNVHRFTHVVWCKRCERRMIAHYGLRASRSNPTEMKRIENFRCTHAGEPNHDKYQIKAAYIEEAVRDAIIWVQVAANRKRLLESYTDRSPQIRRNIEKAKQRLIKNEEAAQRADDAYVLGSMSIERYQRQVKMLEQALARINEDIRQYEAELQAELFDNRRDERLCEVANEGLFWLESDDIPAANAWFRRHIKVWVNNDDPDHRIEVEYL